MTENQPVVPQRLSTLIDDLRPRAEDLPFNRLCQSFKQAQDGGGAGMTPMTSLRGVDQMAETRIREWMKREEELKRLSKNNSPKNAPPQK